MLKRDDSVLLLVDFQEKLRGAIELADQTVARARVLAQGARLLGVPVIASEQYPKGLGKTLPELAPLAGSIFPKARFSAAREEVLQQAIAARKTVLLCGWEAHVCVLQTALELKEAGARPVLVEDAVSSRLTASKQAAIGRLGFYGIEAVNAEMALFEWMETHEHPAFKEVAALIR